MTSSPKAIGVKPEPVKVVVGPLGFHRFASEFLEAAKSVKPTDEFSPVPYYLYCRTIELSLKAFLLTKGVRVKELKERFGHNLVKLLSKARSKSIQGIMQITADEDKEIGKANKYYNSKGFEYFELGNAVFGYPELPKIPILTKLAKRLVKELKQPCIDALQSSQNNIEKL